MKKLILGALLASSITAVSAYDAHEWGTFTSVVGTDGKILQGLHHEEEPLPNFVYDLSKVENTNPFTISINGSGSGTGFPGGGSGGGPITRGFFPQSMNSMPVPVFTERITQKMETPVIYFYSDKNVDVNVRVDFPDGIVSQWFPKTSSHNPSVKAEDGYAVWDVKVIAEGNHPSFPQTSSDSIWNPSRQVKANPIVTGGEAEKLIFYRGLADFDVPLVVFARGNTLTIENKSSQNIKGLTFLNNRLGKKELLDIPFLAANSKKTLKLQRGARGYSSFSSYDSFLKGAKKTIVDHLVKSGLFLDESQAMVNTWEKGYFQTEGLRLLYVLPRQWTDEILPLTFSPSPKNLVRTLVGRVEILTPQDEKEILNYVSTKVRRDEVSIFDINGRTMRGLGHFPEPKLRRALKIGLKKELEEKVKKLIESMNSGFPN